MVLLAGLGGCRTTPGKKGGEATEEGSATAQDSPPSPPMTLPVGLVHHVDETARFVLIRSSRGLQLDSGTVLTIHGNQGQLAARVEVSPARKGAFLAADFLDGLPEKGQQVTMEYQGPTPGNSPAAAALGPEDADAVQVLE